MRDEVGDARGDDVVDGDDGDVGGGGGVGAVRCPGCCVGSIQPELPKWSVLRKAAKPLVTLVGSGCDAYVAVTLMVTRGQFRRLWS